MVEEYHAAGGAGAGKKLNCSPQVLLLSDKSPHFSLTGASTSSNVSWVGSTS